MIATAATFAGGCGIFNRPFAAGDYSADLPCMIDLVDPSGMTAHEEFTSPTTVTIDAAGRFSVNGVELTVGQQVLRSIPTADLMFEVTDITRNGNLMTVTYAPRPTLPGITVEGALVETYRWQAGSILVTANTDLHVTDTSGTSDFTVRCEGVLTMR